MQTVLSWVPFVLEQEVVQEIHDMIPKTLRSSACFYPFYFYHRDQLVEMHRGAQIYWIGDRYIYVHHSYADYFYCSDPRPLKKPKFIARVAY